MKKAWRWFKEQAPVVWRYVKLPLRRVSVFLFVAAIIAGAWYAFLAIVAPPPVATTPALIMIWASVVALLFALFPRILDRVKKIKVKDFELELQETVAKATSKDFITLSDFDNHIFSTKGGFRNLGEILERAVRFPGKPVLLVANLRDGDYISIPMLFIYLFFLDLVGSSVTVLFISTRHPIRSLADIKQDCIVGVVSGKKVLQQFLERFPRLFRILDIRRLNDNFSFEDFFRSGRFRNDGLEGFFAHIHDAVNDLGENRNSYLSEREVEDWFKAELSAHAIEASISASDVQTIRAAIAEGDEFILVLKDDRLSSVVSVSFVTREISWKTLQGVERNET